MPFAGYRDFDDCVRKNRDKNDPEAYCATIMRQVEGDRGGESRSHRMFARRAAKADKGTHLEGKMRKHIFEGTDPRKCAKCERPWSSAIHK